MTPSSLKWLQAHGREDLKKKTNKQTKKTTKKNTNNTSVLSAFQQAAGLFCKAQALKLQMLRLNLVDLIQTSCTRHKLVYLHVTWREMLLTELLLLLWVVMLRWLHWFLWYKSTFVSICFGLSVVLFAACSSTEQGFFVWSLASRCKQATKEVGAITAAAGVLLYWL